jgi:hypothetical protein
MATGAVVARILTQYSDKGSKAAQKDIAKLGKNIDAFAKKSARAFGIAAIASAAALAKISKDSIMAASDLSQQFGALDAVFGQNSEQLKEFSKSMVDYGLSTADAARFAALLGTQLKGLGIEEQEAIKRTKQLQILAADLAATYGGTTADAVAALSSTFKGEYNPIERYGVAIRKSDITARVAAKGLGKLQGDLLKAAEAQAAFELIVTRTTAAQGQSRREYNTLAAQLQRVDATFENIKATLGTALLPIMEKFASVLITKILPQIEQFVNANKNQLAASFAVAAEFAVMLLGASVNFGNWIANNMGLVKTMAALIAGMFVVGRISAFITALNTIITTMKILRATAIGTAVATALATGGASVGTAAVALAGIGATALVTKNLFDIMKGKDVPGVTSGTNSGKYNSISGVLGQTSSTGATLNSTDTALDKFTTALNGATKATKTAKTMQDKINAEAVRQNLARQAKLSGSSTIAIGGGGKLHMPQSGVNVAVTVGNLVATKEDLVTEVMNGIEKVRRRGIGGKFPPEALL